MYMSSIVYTAGGNNQYLRAERKQGSPHHRRCIDGRITGCGNCVGYCSFSEHAGYLTKELRKQHDCIKKGCHYYSAKKKESEEKNPFSILMPAFA